VKLGLFTLGSILVSVAASQAGCIVSNASVDDANKGDGGGSGSTVTTNSTDPADNAESADAPTVKYRALSSHPGCTTDGLSYTAAKINGYNCAAKEYAVKNEDTSKPIVILVHGNSSTPADWETFADDPNHQAMLSERLVAAGFKTYAVDFRIDKVDDPNQNNDTENAAKNFDHGWAEPILAHMIDSVITANPSRKISIVAFSVAPTVTRDALRRLHRDHKKPFEHIQHLVYAAGAHHGVSTFRKLCGSNPTMRGRITCELVRRRRHGLRPEGRLRRQQGQVHDRRHAGHQGRHVPGRVRFGRSVEAEWRR